MFYGNRGTHVGNQRCIYWLGTSGAVYDTGYEKEALPDSVQCNLIPIRHFVP